MRRRGFAYATNSTTNRQFLSLQHLLAYKCPVGSLLRQKVPQLRRSRDLWHGASNNNVKSYLLNGTSNLYGLVEAIEDMLRNQERDFADNCSQDEFLTART